MTWLKWFIAGALAVPLFHQVGLLLLNVAGATDRAAFAMTAMKPFGVPSLVSLSFWGGVWGIILGLVLLRRIGSSFWVLALVIGAIAPTLVAMFVVAPLKGSPMTFDPKFLAGGLLLNGAWGLGTALLYRLMARAPATL